MITFDEAKIRDVADVKGGKRLPKGKQLLTTPNSHPYIRIRDLGKSKILELNSDYEYVDSLTQESIKRYIVSEGDILISVVGTIGLIGIVGKSLHGANQTENCDKITNLKRIDRDYLYYYLKSDMGQNEIKKGTVGAVQPKLPLKNVLDLKIKYPDIDTQRKIAKILNLIDGKITINNEINDNLLKQAIEIYSDLIKDKDKNGCIGDYCTIKSGFAFKSNWWTDNGVKVVKIGSINQDNLDLNSCSYVSSENAVRAKEFIVKGGDLLIAMTGATIGKFAMVPSLNEGIYVNQRVGKFFLGDNPISRLPYIYCTLKQPDIYSEIINRGQGSAQPNISGGDIMSIPCVILSKEDIDDFNQKCKPIFSLMIDRQKENADLSDLRDSLLPKLMSGEIDVDSIEL